LLALAYGLSYDAIVRGFGPYEALLDEIAELIERSSPAAANRRFTKVLDVTCGVGTVAFRLSREGYTVVGLDPVEHLVAVARRRNGLYPASRLTFYHLDLARDTLRGAGTFDVLVSMHTLYWHPDPRGVLEACRRALRPGGYGIFLTYGRPAHVWRTFLEIRARDGIGEAVRALRWLVPTAIFETVRRGKPNYLSQEEFHRALADAGFEVIESRRTFLAQISLLAKARTPEREDREPAGDEGR
jgi:SAM-dependent methyltransferase